MDLDAIYKGVIEGNAPGVIDGINTALEENVSAETLLNEALIAAMDEVGRRFEAGEYFVPEMLIAARAMKGGVEILRPILGESGIKPIGKVLIGTVSGDLHDIGKNLVGLMMEGAGFEVIDMGTDVPPDKFVESVKEHQPQIIGLSALLTTTMPDAAEVIKSLTESGQRDKVKVLIGGAPVTQGYADQIGADGYADDAPGAARKAKELLGLS